MILQGQCEQSVGSSLASSSPLASVPALAPENVSDVPVPDFPVDDDYGDIFLAVEDVIESGIKFVFF